jgi:hypothetical protein
MKKGFKYSLLLLSFIAFFSSKGQVLKDTSYIQFSGLVLTSDSIYPIPYAVVSSNGMGQYTDFNGFFSFAARPGDTVLFTHIQFKSVRFVIPDTLQSFKYNVVQLLTNDTINLPTTIIKALPSRVIFDKVFVNKDIPDDKLERARKNLDKQQLKERAAEMKPSASENFRNTMQNESRKLYYAGQLPPNNLLNPFAWSEFFKAWKRGDFKNKKKK